MATDNSFDVVSKVDIQEVRNAVDQATKEVTTRFDLKDSKSSIEFDGKEKITLGSADEYRLKAVTDILQHKLVKRGVPLKGLKYGTLIPGRTVVCDRRSRCSRGSLRKRRRRSSRH